MAETRWGIVGPGGIARNFADGLAQAPSGRLVALASRNGARRRDFGDRYGIALDRRHPEYALLAADPEVDAVYIATPHPFHAEHALVALAAGKPVLCEKPAGMNAAEVAAVTEAAARHGLLYMEAFMYRCHPQVARMLAIIRSGEIGEVRAVRAAFGFPAHFDPRHRLFDRALGGGGILDVGGYPVSFARLVAGCAVDADFDDPVALSGAGIVGRSGVDELARARLVFGSGIVADVACTIRQGIDCSALVVGSRGSIRLSDPWTPGRDAGPSDAALTVAAGSGAPRTETLRCPEQLYAFEAEVASRAVLERRTAAPAPALSPADSLGNAVTLDRWRRALRVEMLADAPATANHLHGLVPAGLPQVPVLDCRGVVLPRLLLATPAGSLPQLWDAWAEAGGTGFDPGRLAGLALREAALGAWLAARGLAAVATVTVRLEPPGVPPEALESAVAAALGRLRLGRAPVLVLPETPGVPRAEMLAAGLALRDAGVVQLLAAPWPSPGCDVGIDVGDAAGQPFLASGVAPAEAPLALARDPAVILTVAPRTPAGIVATLDGRPRLVTGLRRVGAP